MKIAYIGTTNSRCANISAFSLQHEVSSFDNFGDVKGPEHYNCLFIEYAGENAVAASQIEHPCTIVQTLGIEIYEAKLRRIDWPNIKWLVGLHSHQIDYFKRIWGSLNCEPQNTGVLHLVAPLNEFPLRTDSKNNNVAIVANITGRKGLDQIPEFLRRYPDLHIHHLGKVCKYGGPVWEFIRWRLEKDGNSGRFHYHKIISFRLMNGWLNDMSYIWLPSIQEGQNRGLLEGMCKGLKPIIRRHAGAEELWPKELLYDTLDQIDNIMKLPYTPTEYRSFIEKKYSPQAIVDSLNKYL